MRLYLDGELVGTDAFTGGLALNREAIVIGASNNRNSSPDPLDQRISHRFDGRIDEVAIFAQALEPVQIRMLIERGAGDVREDIPGLSGTLADYDISFETVDGKQVLRLADKRPASADILAYWSLNELAGSTAADAAGAAQDGIYVGHVGMTDAGPPAAGFDAGTGATFDADRSDFVTIAHDPAFEVADGTVQFWFNADRLHSDQVLFAKDHDGLGDGGHLRIRLDWDHLEVRLQSDRNSYTIRTDGIVRSDTWYQLAFTFGADGMKLYLNGTLVGSNGFTGGLVANREPIVIGASNHNNRRDGDPTRQTITDAFDGRIDEVALFGRALDQHQIASLMESGAGPFVDALASGRTVDGADTVQGVETIRFADGTMARVLGAQSEASTTLTPDEADVQGRGRPLVVLGDGVSLQLIGDWTDRGTGDIGSSTFVRYVSGHTVVLVLDTVDVAIEPAAAPITLLATSLLSATGPLLGVLPVSINALGPALIAEPSGGAPPAGGSAIYFDDESGEFVGANGDQVTGDGDTQVSVRQQRDDWIFYEADHDSGATRYDTALPGGGLVSGGYDGQGPAARLDAALEDDWDDVLIVYDDEAALPATV